MSWQPEIEVIDQLLRGDLPLPVVCRLFPDDERARRALAHYVSKRVIVLTRKDVVLASWKCQEMFRQSERLDQYSEVRVSLTDRGARLFQEGGWTGL